MQNNNPISTLPQLKQLLGSQAVKNRFAEILKDKAPAFISSIISAVSGNPQLQKAEPQSILNAAVIAATLDLPINGSLGFAYIVPFGGQAQFQIGYKGIVQLAERSGLYETINVCEVYEGEIASVNRFTGEYVFGEKKSDTVVGYMAYFKLLSGFQKFMYMSKGEVTKHGKKYSQMFKRDKGLWVEAFDAMAEKSVLKRLLSKYGILSIEMQRAQIFDQATIKGNLVEESVDDAEISYDDNPNTPEARRNAIKEAMKAEAEETNQEGPDGNG